MAHPTSCTRILRNRFVDLDRDRPLNASWRASQRSTTAQPGVLRFAKRNGLGDDSELPVNSVDAVRSNSFHEVQTRAACRAKPSSFFASTVPFLEAELEPQHSALPNLEAMA
jgi:hypothetical protein